MSAAQPDLWQSLTQDWNWLGIVILIWAIGGFTWLGNHYRQIVSARREAAEIRHQRAVELELARRGVLSRKPADDADEAEPLALASFTERWTEAVKSGRPAIMTLPAAVIPSPPGVSRTGVPGECRHERIVPVIDGTGELRKWVCANYPRCDAGFDKSVAIYEPAEGES